MNYCNNDIFQFIDYTSLNGYETDNDIIKMVNTNNIIKSNFNTEVASICIYPNKLQYLRQNYKGVITCVAGSFPNSATFLKVKLMEIEYLINNGVNEIDIVLSLSDFFDKKYDKIYKEISSIYNLCYDNSIILKVILEVAVLNDIELITIASNLVIDAGCDFIKTSTGKASRAFYENEFVAMLEVIKYKCAFSDKKIGIKAAGGISNFEDSIGYINLVNSILGKEWLNSNLFRIGASSLINNLLNEFNDDNFSY